MRLNLTLLLLLLLVGCSSSNSSVQGDQQLAADLTADSAVDGFDSGIDLDATDLADLEPAGEDLLDQSALDLVPQDAPLDVEPQDIVAGSDLEDPSDSGDLLTVDKQKADLVVVPQCNLDAVYLKDGKFYRGKQPYTMMTMNYIFGIRKQLVDGKDTYYLAPHHAFCADNRCCMTKTECIEALRADLKTIAELGFNSLRMLALTIQPENGNLVVPCLTNVLPDKLEPCAPLVVQTANGEGPWRKTVFDFIEQALDEMGKVKLKGVLHGGHHELDAEPHPTLYKEYLSALAGRFKSDSRLIGIDLWNEPPYQQKNDLTKQQVHALVRSWYDAIRAQSNQLLVTVGLTNGGTVFNWDPLILPLDFVSYHVYPNGGFSGLQVAKYEHDYEWFSTVDVTWIIGETGFTVQDWGTEAMQKTFASRSLELTRDCGGRGYSWWIYQDLHWGQLEHFGLLRWDETQRPAAAVFKGFDWSTTGTCPVSTGYFNPDGHSAFTVEGRVLDSAGNPVPYARIRGWRCPDWSGGPVVTYSAADGTFKLSSDLRLVHVQITAAGMTIDKGIWPNCKSIKLGDRSIQRLTLDTSVSTPNVCPALPK